MSYQTISNRQVWTFILAATITCFSCKKSKEAASCPKDVSLKGKISKTASGGYQYRSSGGGTFVLKTDFNGINVLHDDYNGFKVSFWGDTDEEGDQWNTSGNQENLNGTHIKNRVGNVRSFIFPDDAKMTFVASGEQLPLIQVSIYEGNECHRIIANCLYVSISSTGDAAKAKQLDDAEPDGETSTIEFTTDGLQWINIYDEQTPGNKIMNRVLLGEIFRAFPNKVDDYYDDPRLGHT